MEDRCGRTACLSKLEPQLLQVELQVIMLFASYLSQPLFVIWRIPTRNFRQKNTWFAFTPCCRASDATDKADDNVCSTIRGFSSAVLYRRCPDPPSAHPTPSTIQATPWPTVSVRAIHLAMICFVAEDEL
jgi:hypothetical protein